MVAANSLRQPHSTRIPNYSIGRSMKVGKEEIVGLLVALENFISHDHDADRQKWERMCGHIADGLQEVPGVKAEHRFWEKLSIPCTWIEVDESVLGLGLEQIHEKLRAQRYTGVLVGQVR